MKWIDPLGLSGCPIKWKGFEKGKLKTHYDKHVIDKGEFGTITQKEYLDKAKNFSKKDGLFNETQIGNIYIKHDPVTQEVLIGNTKKREIRSYYKAECPETAFSEAIDTATKKTKT